MEFLILKYFKLYRFRNLSIFLNWFYKLTSVEVYIKSYEDLNGKMHHENIYTCLHIVQKVYFSIKNH